MLARTPAGYALKAAGAINQAGQCGNVSNICILHISLVYLFTLNYINVNK